MNILTFKILNGNSKGKAPFQVEGADRNNIFQCRLQESGQYRASS
jgi:hypothetical protein